MDTILNRLKAGDSIGRKARRNRLAGSSGSRSNIPPVPQLTPQLTGSVGSGEAADIAKDMLAALRQGGFTPIEPPSPRPPQTRRTRIRGSLRTNASGNNSDQPPATPLSDSTPLSPPAEDVKGEEQQALEREEAESRPASVTLSKRSDAQDVDGEDDDASNHSSDEEGPPGSPTARLPRKLHDQDA
jgi:hypothetical protein